MLLMVQANLCEKHFDELEKEGTSVPIERLPLSEENQGVCDYWACEASAFFYCHLFAKTEESPKGARQ